LKTFLIGIDYVTKQQDKMSSYDHRYAPSLYEIQCENGDIEEEYWEDQVFDCGDYYTIGYYKYAKSFPQEWAQNHLEGTGPEQCGNCYEYGSKDGVFVGYCANCAQYDYNGERGPGMMPIVEESEPIDAAESELVTSPCVETEAERITRIGAQLLQHAKDLDYVFQLAKGKVKEGDQRFQEFFGIEKE
jgi:hypothetical protein